MPEIRVCSFESRRGEEMSLLISKCGGIPTIAPSLKEIPVEANEPVFEFGRRLLAGEFQCVIFLTGVGTTALFDLLKTRIPVRDVLNALERCRVVARGPKPQAALRKLQVRIDHIIPEPNTWREIVAALDEAAISCEGLSIAIQEYGGPSPELVQAFVERRAQVTTVPVYRWELPDDLAPLESAIRRTISGEFQILLWTSAQQVNHAVTVADRMGVKEEWLRAAQTCFTGSIGPVASERLLEYGMTPSLEPSHSRMGQLVKEALEAFRSANRCSGEQGA